MGIATLWFWFGFGDGRDVDPLLDRLFGMLFPGLIQPKSIVFEAVGHPRTILQGSVDPVPRQRFPDDCLFPGEYEVPGAKLTKLESPCPYLCAEGADAAAVDELRGLVRGWIEGRARTRASLDVWGLTNVYYLTRDGELCRDWFLREVLPWPCERSSYHAILRTFFRFPSPHPRQHECSLILHSFARLWSEYADPPIKAKARWPRKDNVAAAEANCAALAEKTAAFLSGFRPDTLEWGDESEHLPPINRILRRELEKRIGPPRVRRPV